MKLPNGDQAIVDDAKVRDYCLSHTHPRGKHKAKLFAAALGITSRDLLVLKAALLTAARESEVSSSKVTAFGLVFRVHFSMTHSNRTAQVLSVWIISPNQPIPRLITCYPD